MLKAAGVQRILLKLSGEALQGESDDCIDGSIVLRLASEIKELSAAGFEIGLVIGGGNILRGAAKAAEGMDRITGDYMGMLATVINALAMQEALERCGQAARVMSALAIDRVCEVYDHRRAVEHLRNRTVVLFGAGTGNPFFTTDSAASLRAIEIQADLLIKATKVDGVYSSDPLKDATARFYARLTYDQALEQRLNVMDMTALILCREHNLRLRVMNIFSPRAIFRLLQGEDVGSLIEAG